MINNAKFQIIGRIGNITKGKKVTHISIASDRQAKDAEGNWSTEASWNNITIFSEAIRKRLTNKDVGKKGNLIIAEGNIQSGSYDKDGETTYTTDLIVQDFNVLSFVKESK